MRAEEALTIGLVDRVVPAAEVLDTALEWAASLAIGRGRRHGHRQAGHRRRARRLARRPVSTSRPRASSRCSAPTTPRSASAASSTTAPARPPSRRRVSERDDRRQLPTVDCCGGGLEVLGVGGEDEPGLDRLVGRRVPRLHERGVRRVERRQLRGVERRGGAEERSRSWSRTARDPRASRSGRRPAGCGSHPSRCRRRRARTSPRSPRRSAAAAPGVARVPSRDPAVERGDRTRGARTSDRPGVDRRVAVDDARVRRRHRGDHRLEERRVAAGRCRRPWVRTTASRCRSATCPRPPSRGSSWSRAAAPAA